MKNSICSIFISLILLLSIDANARYATKQESPVELQFQNVVMDIDKTGRYKATVEKQYEILNDAGREVYGSNVLIYTKDVSDIEVIEAKTIIEGKEYVVHKENIEIKPLASSEKGFDQKYQILISYPNVVIGSKLYLKYKEVLHTPVLENVFTNILSFGSSEYTLDTSITINSEILNLQYLANDPNGDLDITKEEQKDKLIYKIKLKRPVYYAVVNEDYAVSNDFRSIPYIYLSNLKSHEDLSKLFAPEYEKVVSKKLPTLYSEIVSKAKKIKDENEQMDLVTSMLSENIRYMGSWQSIKGKFFPRDLATIAKTGFADCKEFASSTAAMLKNLGYQVNVAMVFRGYSYIENPKKIPTIEEFNHAILVVVSPSGKRYWLDPTNLVSMSKGIFPDISGRHSLVLDSKKPKYDYILPIDCKKSKKETSNEITLSSNKIKQETSIKLIGERAFPITGKELQTSKQYIEDLIFNLYSGVRDLDSKFIELPDLKSRIVKDVYIKLGFVKDENLLRTNLGNALVLTSLSEDWQRAFTNSSTDQVGLAYLADPYTFTSRTKILNYKAKSPESLNYKINSKWFTAKRECKQVDNNIEINESIELMNSVIFPEEVKTDEFKMLRKEILQQIQSTVLVGERL